MLTADHPQYRPGAPGEVHATLPGTLTISGRTSTFQPSYAPPATDATGTPDYGHINTVSPADEAGTRWHLSEIGGESSSPNRW